MAATHRSRYLVVLRAFAGPAGSKETVTLPGLPMVRLVVIVATVDLVMVLVVFLRPSPGDGDLAGAEDADLERDRRLARCFLLMTSSVGQLGVWM